jgi:glycosyltransferase involved in cell wall biosynthesis
MRIALLLNNPFTMDSRSWKLATSLAAARHDVTVIARADGDLPSRETHAGYRVVRLAPVRTLGWLPAPGLPPASAGRQRRPGVRDRLRDTVGRAAQAARYLLRTRSMATAIERELAAADGPGAPVDIWQAEGLVMLPVALRLRRRLGGHVVYDSRDIGPQSARFARLPGFWRRLLSRSERGWARAADAIVTVNRPYADELRKAFGRDPMVVPNGPLPFDPPEPPERRFHDRLGLPPGQRVALMVGAVVAHRGIELACAAIGDVPATALVVVGDGEAKSRIVAGAARHPHADRIHFMASLPPADLLAWTASADVAVMPIEPSTLNHRLTTPTRLYDAMGAGVPVVASDLPGMAAVVRETGIGVLVDPTSASAIAAGIREVLDAPPERRVAWRAACLAAARGPYAWHDGVDRLIALYERLAAS